MSTAEGKKKGENEKDYGFGSSDFAVRAQPIDSSLQGLPLA